MKDELHLSGTNEDLFFGLGMATQQCEMILVELSRRGLVPKSGFYIAGEGPARPTKWTQYFKPVA
jgi:hypothetical protein